MSEWFLFGLFVVLVVAGEFRDYWARKLVEKQREYIDALEGYVADLERVRDKLLADREPSP